MKILNNVYVKVNNEPYRVFSVVSEIPQDILKDVISMVEGGSRLIIAEELAENHEDAKDGKIIAILGYDGSALLPSGKAKYLKEEGKGKNKTVELFAQTHEGNKQHHERIDKVVKDYKNRVDRIAEYWIARGFTLTITQNTKNIQARLQKYGEGNIDLGYVNCVNGLYYAGQGKNSINLSCK